VQGAGQLVALVEREACMIDPDQSIPYRLTAKAKRELETWRLEEQMDGCEHLFTFVNGELVCDWCGYVVSPARSLATKLPHKYGKYER
jgi:hypothetical protein